MKSKHGIFATEIAAMGQDMEANKRLDPLVEGVGGVGRRRWDSNPRRLITLHDFQSCSLDHYETPPDKAQIPKVHDLGRAERVGFEPTKVLPLPHFEGGSFDLSDISPLWSIT